MRQESVQVEERPDQTIMAKKQNTGVLQEQLNAQRKPFLAPILSILSVLQTMFGCFTTFLSRRL